MTCDQSVADAEFQRILKEEADPLEKTDCVELISRARADLEHYARDFLARYDDQFRCGTALPPQATMEVRGLITIMQITAQKLNVALGKFAGSG